MSIRALGILRTTTGDAPGARQPIPGVKVRNDGVYDAALAPGLMHRLAHDGIGWQLTPEGEPPHAYLVDGELEPLGELELTDGMLALLGDRQYVVAEDDSGEWVVHEHVPAMS